MELQTYNEIIECPNCQDVQVAKVVESIPWNIYIHTCTNCEYRIMESEWNEIDEQEFI